jgi:hypothetical protein
MDPIKVRMRYLVGILVAAVVIAAALRHFLHVSLGFAPREILIGALVASAVASVVTAIFFRRRRS